MILLQAVIFGIQYFDVNNHYDLIRKCFLIAACISKVPAGLIFSQCQQIIWTLQSELIKAHIGLRPISMKKDCLDILIVPQFICLFNSGVSTEAPTCSLFKQTSCTLQQSSLLQPGFTFYQRCWHCSLHWHGVHSLAAQEKSRSQKFSSRSANSPRNIGVAHSVVCYFRTLLPMDCFFLNC